MPTWSRATALLTMTSAAGADVLIPIHLSAREGISQTFVFEIDAVSQNGALNPDDLLFQPACVTLQASGSPVRYFHGIVQHISSDGAARGAAAGEYYAYRLVLVPKLWFLGQTMDSRVYQKKTAVDILQAMFTDMGVTDVTLPSPGATREYTVQFNESDLTFASRIMEEEGYFYFFTHTAGKHQLVIGNQNTLFTDIDGATLRLQGGDIDGMNITGWSFIGQTVRGKMTLKDYDPVNPDTVLKSDQPTTLQTGGAATRDDFRWPAGGFTSDAVANRAQWEMEAAEAVASLFEGSTQYGALVPGGKFTITSRPATASDATYVVRFANHHAADDTWLNGGNTVYSCQFTCFKAAVTWRQPAATPRPRMEGIHVGLVLGPQHNAGDAIQSQNGEEVHTDDLGRVKVRFYWDHRAEATGGDSVWARVVQPWGGKGWGAQFFPRVGTEVAVGFVDGDPDRPIVLGGLYNGRDTPIYAATDKTKSGFRSRSSPSGGATNFNEFTWDDKKGNELIFTQAEKDLTTYVKNDQTLTVDNCRIVTIKKDETVDIQNNQTIKVKQDHTFTITDGNRVETISKGNDSLEISKGDRSAKIGTGNDSLEISKGNRSTKIAMGNDTLDVSMGNLSIKAGAGKIDIEAMQGITLKVGGSTVKIDQMGVAISGMTIKVEGQLSTDIKGLMTKVGGDAMLTLKGAITMVN